MNLDQVKSHLPKTDKNVISVLSGGLDSSVATMILTEHYGVNRVKAISFDYGQKQKVELEKASTLCAEIGISHRILDLSILGEIARPFSSNILGSNIAVPPIQEVLGDPMPKTYVPNRNMIMYSIAAAAAEVEGASEVFCGLQVHDSYGYHDTTQQWVDSMNVVLAHNRKNPIKISAPFAALSKYDEIMLVKEMRVLDLLKYTLTCYDPDETGRSCGKCGSCAERIAAFGRAGIVDPVEYSIPLDWDKIFYNYRVKEDV